MKQPTGGEPAFGGSLSRLTGVLPEWRWEQKVAKDTKGEFAGFDKFPWLGFLDWSVKRPLLKRAGLSREAG